MIRTDPGTRGKQGNLTGTWESVSGPSRDIHRTEAAPPMPEKVCELARLIENY